MDNIPYDSSEYVKNVFKRKGIEGLISECNRMIRKLDAAETCARMSSHKVMFLHGKQLINLTQKNIMKEDAFGIAMCLDQIQSYVLELQRYFDKNTKISLILHTDEEKWEKHESYTNYVDSYSFSNKGA